MSKHTPGPWTFVHEGGIDGGYFIDAKEDVVVLPRGRLNEADARLIAAAPDLLAALRAIVNKAHPRADYLNGDATHYIGPKELVDAARAAIAKAEGTS